MAEFCLDCLNKISELKLTQHDVILSKDLDLCEECKSLKHVVVRYRTTYRIKQFFGEY